MGDLVLNAGLFSWLGDWFYGLWVNLMLLIDNVIYIFINWLYRIFMLVAEVDIFKDGTQLEAIAQRLYIIVGIAMLFIFAYNLILLIVNPEGKQLGDMGKLVQRAIVSVILVTLLPFLFSLLSSLQSHILQSNVIGHVILGTSSGDQAVSNKKAGVDVALTIFSAFYHPEGQTLQSCRINSSAHELCTVYVTAYENAYNNEAISDFIWNKELKDGAKEGKMEYNWIISAAAGIWALWCFVSFALDIGVRVGKLAFYEVISPIPVMMRILPGDKMFDKWFNGIKNTYLSLFVRLAVIYFCMYAITLVPDILTNMWSEGDNWLLLALANVVVILGILQFAKEAPKLLSDLFGGSGDGLKFGIKDKYKSAAAPLGRVADMARSGVYSRLYGGMNGEGGSFWAGAWRGRKGFEKGTAATDAHSEAISNGSTWSGRMQDRMRNAVGMKTRYDSAGADAEKVMKKEKIEKRREHNKVASDAISTLKEKAGSVVTDRDSTYRSTGSQYSDFVDRKYLSAAGQFNKIDGGNGNQYDLNGKNYYEMEEVLQQAIQDNASATAINEIKQNMSDFKTSAKTSGKTYNLNSKNHYEMKAVLDEAIRNNASAETVTELERAIESFEKTNKDLVIDNTLKGDYSNIQGRYKDTMANTIQDLQTQIAEGAAETLNTATGKLESGIKDVNGQIISTISDVSQFKDADKAIKQSERDMFVRERDIKKNDGTFKAKKADRDYINNTKNNNGK